MVETVTHTDRVIAMWIKIRHCNTSYTFIGGLVGISV